MAQPRRIYLLDSKKLSPETIAVAFAKTSRSPKSFDEIADDLSDSRSADFHEKWVVGYGHSSVAEHAVLHIAVENLSRLAVECLESNRLASYTEKSSRYQIWDKNQFYIPDEISGRDMERSYIDTCELLFEEYLHALNAVGVHLAEIDPDRDDETERAFTNRIRARSADVCRYYLPASSLANVGVSINARALEHALQKMLSHSLSEVREIGEEIKNAALECTPTLVKYAERNDYLIQIEEKISRQASKVNQKVPSMNTWCECTGFDKDGEFQVLAALLVRFSDASYTDAYDLYFTFTAARPGENGTHTSWEAWKT